MFATTSRRALALALAVATLAGCEPGEGSWVGPVPPSTPRVERVAIQGDSLVDCPGCDEAWVAGPLAAEHPLALWSVSGSKLGDGGWFRRLTPRPHVAVVAQGTNNARDGWDAGDRAAQRATLAALEDVPCVVVVDMGWGPDSVPSHQQAMTDGNEAWAALAAADPRRITVAGWQPRSATRPEWFTADGIHHTAAGQAAYRSVVTQAIDAALARGCGPGGDQNWK